MDFSETIVVFDVKVGKCSKLNEYMNVYEYQTSRSFIGLGPRSLRFTPFSSVYSLETARPIEAKFHVKPPWDIGIEFCSNDPGHMTNMTAMSMYSESLEKLLLWNLTANDLESWYPASGTQIPSLFK